MAVAAYLVIFAVAGCVPDLPAHTALDHVMATWPCGNAVRDALASEGLVPVLFAGSDRDFARREAERVGMPPAALREVRSVELTMRDGQIHAPSILVFTGRRGPAPLGLAFLDHRGGLVVHPVHGRVVVDEHRL